MKTYAKLASALMLGIVWMAPSMANAAILGRCREGLKPVPPVDCVYEFAESKADERGLLERSCTTTADIPKIYICRGKVKFKTCVFTFDPEKVNCSEVIEGGENQIGNSEKANKCEPIHIKLDLGDEFAAEVEDTDKEKAYEALDLELQEQANLACSLKQTEAEAKGYADQAKKLSCCKPKTGTTPVPTTEELPSSMGEIIKYPRSR